MKVVAVSLSELRCGDCIQDSCHLHVFMLVTSVVFNGVSYIVSAVDPTNSNTSMCMAGSPSSVVFKSCMPNI